LLWSRAPAGRRRSSSRQTRTGPSPYGTPSTTLSSGRSGPGPCAGGGAPETPHRVEKKAKRPTISSPWGTGVPALRSRETLAPPIGSTGRRLRIVFNHITVGWSRMVGGHPGIQAPATRQVATGLARRAQGPSLSPPSPLTRPGIPGQRWRRRRRREGPPPGPDGGDPGRGGGVPPTARTAGEAQDPPARAVAGVKRFLVVRLLVLDGFQSMSKPNRRSPFCCFMFVP